MAPYHKDLGYCLPMTVNKSRKKVTNHKISFWCQKGKVVGFQLANTAGFTIGNFSLNINQTRHQWTNRVDMAWDRGHLLRSPLNIRGHGVALKITIFTNLECIKEVL